MNCQKMIEKELVKIWLNLAVNTIFLFFQGKIRKLIKINKN